MTVTLQNLSRFKENRSGNHGSFMRLARIKETWFLSNME